MATIFNEGNLIVTSEEMGVINKTTTITQIDVENNVLYLTLDCDETDADDLVSKLCELGNEEWFLWQGEWTEEDEMCEE